MDAAESSLSLSTQQVEILRLFGPIDILYIEKDKSWKVVHNALVAILESKIDSAGWLMLIVNLSLDKDPNLIAYRYQLYPGFTTVFRTTSNALILLDYDNLNNAIVLLLPPTSRADRAIVAPLKDIFEVNFLEHENPDEDRKSAASRVPGVVRGFLQAGFFIRTKTNVIAPHVREKAVEAFSSFLEGFEKPSKQNHATSLISPEVMNLICGFHEGSSLSAQGASKLMLTSGEALKKFGGFVEPRAKWAAANMLEAFANMKAEQANEIVNDTTEVIKHSGLFVMTMSDVLLCIAKNLSAIPIDCANNLIGHFYDETAAEAWMKTSKIKDNLEQGILPFKYVEKAKDLFKESNE